MMSEPEKPSDLFNAGGFTICALWSTGVPRDVFVASLVWGGCPAGRTVELPCLLEHLPLDYIYKLMEYNFTGVGVIVRSIG